ncbi:MAG: hypothetical protein Q8O04_00170 [Deltaproteobacteria bacterium]|nr:hypothetical protein [Deltaproteobacteria bacterium]
MLKTVWAIIRHGKIEPLEPIPLSEGTKVLVTLLPDEDERGFWLGVSEYSLAKIWENAEDDIYAELL